jgi:hypothetical protein
VSDKNEELEQEVRTFYSGAKIFLPFILTIIVTLGGWLYTAITSARERGSQEETIRYQGEKIANVEGRFNAFEARLNSHDVTLGKFETQLARIEKTGDETNRLLNEFLSARTSK